MRISMVLLSVNPCPAWVSHKLSAQKSVFLSCAAVVLFTPRTTRAQHWSVLFSVFHFHCIASGKLAVEISYSTPD